MAIDQHALGRAARGRRRLAQPVSFSVVIVTKERPRALSEALRSVARALPSDGEVIVVDGDPARSAADPYLQLRLAHPDVGARYLVSAPGTTRQRNLGIDAARGEVVVFIDDDCTVQEDLFSALAAAYGDRSVIGVTGLICEPTRKPRVGSQGRLRWLLLGGGRQGTMSSFGFRHPLVDLTQPCDIEFMYGPLMSARRSHAAQVRFDERLTGYALGEDDDFSYRLSRHGRLRYEPAAVVHHNELGRRGMDQRYVDRMRVINRTYLFHKNFPATPGARARFTCVLAMTFVHRVLNREWSGLRGLFEGLVQARRSAGLPAAVHGARSSAKAGARSEPSPG